MNFIKLFFYLLSSPILKYRYEKTLISVHNGYDERYPLSESNNTANININEFDFSNDDQILLEKIGKYFIYKDFLKTLENNKVSIQEKLRIIEENNLMQPSDSYVQTANLLAGGLMNDFNFEL
jgi:hypothetical protein